MQQQNDDPWGSLADSLGVSGADEGQPKPAEQPRPRPKAEPRRRPPAASDGSRSQKPPAAWSSLAEDLGLEPDRAPPPPPRQERRPPAESDAATGSPRRERSAEPTADRDERRNDLAEEGSAGRGAVEREREEGDRGEGRGRRRRGRRGGRRRSGSARGDGPSDERPLAGDRPADFEGRIGRTSDITDGDAPAGADDLPETADATAGNGGESSGSGDDSGDPRRRRRRRGRRGGRRRRSGEGGSEEPGRQGSPRSRGSSREEGERDAAARPDHDDEPLPTGYGMPSRRSETAAPGESRERSRSEAGRGETADGSRRRRRRGGRRRSEKSSEDRGSKSRSRGARRDFAPVAGSFEEDDEGLEFLGLDETARPRQKGAEAAAEDQDVLVESGLAEVLDVPSWVEAIGIVIAGNLDARTRSREDRHR